MFESMFEKELSPEIKDILYMAITGQSGISLEDVWYSITGKKLTVAVREQLELWVAALMSNEGVPVEKPNDQDKSKEIKVQIEQEEESKNRFWMDLFCEKMLSHSAPSWLEDILAVILEISSDGCPDELKKIVAENKERIEWCKKVLNACFKYKAPEDSEIPTPGARLDKVLEQYENGVNNFNEIAKKVFAKIKNAYVNQPFPMWLKNILAASLKEDLIDDVIKLYHEGIRFLANGEFKKALHKFQASLQQNLLMLHGENFHNDDVIFLQLMLKDICQDIYVCVNNVTLKQSSSYLDVFKDIKNTSKLMFNENNPKIGSNARYKKYQVDRSNLMCQRVVPKRNLLWVEKKDDFFEIINDRVIAKYGNCALPMPELLYSEKDDNSARPVFYKVNGIAMDGNCACTLLDTDRLSIVNELKKNLSNALVKYYLGVDLKNSMQFWNSNIYETDIQFLSKTRSIIDGLKLRMGGYSKQIGDAELEYDKIRREINQKYSWDTAIENGYDQLFIRLWLNNELEDFKKLCDSGFKVLEADKLFDIQCQSKENLELFLKLYEVGIFVGINSMQAFSFLKAMNLKIFVKDGKEDRKCVLKYHYKPESTISEVVIGIYDSSRQHFDALEIKTGLTKEDVLGKRPEGNAKKEELYDAIFKSIPEPKDIIGEDIDPKISLLIYLWLEDDVAIEKLLADNVDLKDYEFDKFGTIQEIKENIIYCDEESDEESDEEFGGEFANDQQYCSILSDIVPGDPKKPQEKVKKEEKNDHNPQYCSVLSNFI